MGRTISEQIAGWVKAHRDEAIGLVSQLVQMDSVNHPPFGNEAECQRFIAHWLAQEGASVDVYEPTEVEGLIGHPAYMSGREYANRPNVAGTFAGTGGAGGRSIVFSSHADTVYEGAEPWSHAPFAAEIADGCLFGRGSYDMKGGMAASMIAVKCLRALGIKLRGDVIVESVVDEEHGGANGTLAARLRGSAADMAIIPEPTNLRLYPAHLGGGIWKAEFSGRSGISFNGEVLVSALEAAADFVVLLREFNAYRLNRDTPPDWWKTGKRAEAVAMSLHSGDHTRKVQEKVPSTGEVNFWIEGYPGATGEDIMSDFQDYLQSRLPDYPSLRSSPPQITPLIRYLNASEMKLDQKGQNFLELVRSAGARVLGEACDPPCGAPFACDGFMFNLHSDTPALVLGPGGGNAHAPDEYLELDSYLKLIQWYAEIIADWCGVEMEELP